MGGGWSRTHWVAIGEAEGQKEWSRTATGLCLGLLGHGSLPPLGPSLLDQALLAGVLMFDLCALGLRGNR